MSHKTLPSDLRKHIASYLPGTSVKLEQTKAAMHKADADIRKEHPFGVSPLMKFPDKEKATKEYKAELASGNPGIETHMWFWDDSMQRDIPN